jgi:hypothetical protein
MKIAQRPINCSLNLRHSLAMALTTSTRTSSAQRLTDPVVSVDARVEDYLNDKLQTASDLAGLDELIAEVTKQQLVIQKQVSSTSSGIDVSCCIPQSINCNDELTVR